MAYNNIRPYVKPHGSGSNSNGDRVVQIINRGSANGFDPKYVNINTLDAHNANIDNLTATNVNIDNADFVYLVSQNGIIQKLQGSELTYDNGRINKLQSDEIETNKLSVKEEANIKNLIADYIQSNNITTDYLTVNKSAHFFELVIDKIRSVQGTQMNTAANCVADYVEWYDANDNLTDDINEVDYFRVYWRSTDDDGKAITNDWLPRDQALCESFNIGTGQHDNTQNKYYWRFVENTSSDAGESIRYIDFDNDDVREVQPLAFTITFTKFEYGDEVDYTHNFTNFIITPQILGQWNSSTQTWTPTSTLYGLQLTKANNDGIVLTGGKFMLNTSSPTKLNIGLYYDDGTYEYFPCSGYASSYLITSQDNKNIEAIIINTAVISKWEPCNWIDLSNTDCDTNTKNAIPTAGDNIVQLGYRYNELPDTPTQDDIQRASAIIISAYQTPDSGVYPPSYAQYQNITDYSLSNHRKTFFDSRQARFVGDFTIQSTGQDIEQYIDDVVNGKTGTIHLDLQKHMVGTVHEFIIPSDTNLTTSTFTNLQGLYFYLYDTNGNRIFPNDPDWDYSNDRTFVVLDGRQFTISGYNSNTVTVDGITMAYGMNSDAMTISFSGNPITWRNENTNMQIMVRYNGNDYMLTIPIYVMKSQEGTDGELWRLSPVKELAYVDTNMIYKYDIGYKVQHLVGDQSHYYTNDLPSDYKLRAYTYNNVGSSIGYIEANSSEYNINGVWAKSGQDDNWPANKETYIVIQLLKNGDIIDTRTIDVIMETTGYVNVTNGHTSLIQANTNSIASLEETADEIQLTVSNHTNQINQNTTNIGQLSITTGQINLGLQSVTTTVTGIQTGLRNTGIDIEDGTINLQADKVTFSNSDGTVNDKISIDPTTGTLNAENANIGGIINANISYSPFIVLNENNATFNSSTNLYDLQLENYITGNGVSVASNFALWDGDPYYELNAILPEPYTDRNGMELTFVGIPQTRIPNGYVRISGSIMYDDGVSPDFVGATPIWPVKNTMIKMVNASFGYIAGWWITEGEFYIDNPATNNNPRLVSLSNKTPATLPYKSITSNYTTTQFDTVIEAKSPNITITLNYLNANVGKTIMVLASFDKNSSMTINTVSSKNIVDAGSLKTSIRLDGYKTLTFLWTGSMWWVFAHH